MRITVTGLQGQVAQSLLARGLAQGHTITAIGRPDLDLADDNAEEFYQALGQTRPDAIVSAAAYTAVDQAESERETAFAVNARGPGHIAQAAARLGTPLIHLSTDYVFSGNSGKPYCEQDLTAPRSVYGASKLAGEHAVLAEHANAVVLRTAWVISPFGRNFAKTMLNLARTRSEISVVCDQVGNPTCALDIADAVLQIANNLLSDRDPALRGLFHLSASGETSWAGLAEAIFRRSAELGGASATVNPIPSSEYPTPASRPMNSRLDCSKVEQLHGVRLPNWIDALPKTVDVLFAEKH